MTELRRVHGRGEKYVAFWLENQERREHLGYLDICGRIIIC
jgi:hypothetical protein